jgi:O-methyltransferase involved in polyketide biosynthesis
MNNKIKIDLGEIQRTLLIPLYGRAKEYEKKHPLVRDQYAHEMINKIDFDFESEFKRMPIQSSINSAIRAYHFDSALLKVIAKYPDTTVVNIGAGLDTTFQRIDNGKMFWYDLDLPDSMELRKNLIPETDRNRFIAKSVFDRSWFKDIKERRSKVFFMAAGVLVYLHEEEIKQLFLDLIREFPESEIIFDIYSKIFLWLRNHVLARRRRTLLAPWKWGVNSAKALAKWSDKITIIDEFPYYSKISLQEYWDKEDLSSLKVIRFFKSMKIVQLKFG